MIRILARLRHFCGEDRGQALAITGLSMVLLFSFAGLAIDVGQLRFAQRKLQSEADAAAIAGALEISYCGGTTDCPALQTAAQQALVENGVTGSTLLTQCASGSGSNVTLTVNNGPCAMGSTASDPNYGNTSYVETVVSKQKLTYFLKIFGINSVNLSARAEATLGNDPYCLFLTGTSGTTLETNAGSSLSASCGIAVASNGSPAVQANSGSSVSATSIVVNGSTATNGATINPTPVTGAPAFLDPLSGLPAPTVGGCTYNNTAVNSSTTLNPGTYCGGLSINSSSTVTFNPGVYIIEGGLAVNDGCTATGNGVMFYVDTGAVAFNKGSSADLVAPTTGTYAGILFFQNSTDSSTADINAGGSVTFQGALYFPDAQLQLNASNNAAYTIVDAESLQMDKNSSFSLGDNYSSLPGGSPAKGVTAVLAQ